MGQYSEAVLATPGLRGYWPIGGSLVDASGHGLNAVNGGARPLDALNLLSELTDPGGSSVDIDGVSYLQVGHNALLLPASPGFAVEAWGRLRSFNPTASEYRGLVGKTNTMIMRIGPSAPSAPNFQTYYYDATPTALPISANAFSPFPLPAVNTVYHIIAETIDNGDGTFTQRQYVNGKLNASGNRPLANASWSAAANTLQLGAWSTRIWDGQGQHFAWYGEPIGGARAAHHYRLGVGLERRGMAERRFTFKAGTPAGIDGSIVLPYGGALDLSEAMALGGIVTADAEVVERLRALDLFDELAA